MKGMFSQCAKYGYEAAMLEMFREKCHSKVVALDIPFGDYEMVRTDDIGAFYEITKHIYEEHYKQKVYFLSGFKDYDISTRRLNGFLKYTAEQALVLPWVSLEQMRRLTE